MNQMADAVVLQSVHCIYIFMYRPYCLKRKTKILKIILFFGQVSHSMAVHIIKQTNKKKKSVYLQIAATYSLLPMPLKYLTLLLSVSAWTLYSFLHWLVGGLPKPGSFIIYCLNEWSYISLCFQLYVGFRARR